MFNHVYPAWHKPAQKAFFLIAAILCITLPALYGSQKPRKISGKAMGAVLGVYFGLWTLFCFVVRFLVPSPTVETALPSYDPSPIPEPVILHTPSRAGVVPTSPAIRLNKPTNASTGQKEAKGARFADDTVKEPSFDTPTARQINNVTFQARPRVHTTDSSNSVTAYPTYATYRQSQHGNFDAFAQRIKRVFAASQQLKQEQELQQQQELEQQLGGGMQQMDDVSVDLKTMDAESKGFSAFTPLPPNGRPRSTSTTGSMLSDLADRIRSGSLFNRSQSFSLTRSLTEPQSISSINYSKNDNYYNNSSSNNNDSYLRYSETQLSGVNATEIPAMEVVMMDSTPSHEQQSREDEQNLEARVISLSNVIPLDKEKEKET